ncbi:MAG TPA: PadR family transcriptional regulator [Vicinamibacterales bacterium]
MRGKPDACARARSGSAGPSTFPRIAASYAYYLPMTDIDTFALDRELKKGAAELLLLSVLEARPRHGYELSKLIETQSAGRLVFHLDSLYPLLYRLEERGWIKGAWVEKANERRRRFYRLTPTGQRVLARQRQTWDEFVEAVRLVTRGEHA